MKKKAYIIPFVDATDLRFEHLMTGTVTNVGGTGGGYGGGGTGGGRTKEYNDFDPQIMQEIEENAEEWGELW